MADVAIAIDFGTSRTKVGWRDESNQIHELMWNGSPYLPSVFHLPPGCSEILIGDLALEAIEDDPQGGIENFKRQMLEEGAIGMTYPDRQDSPQGIVAYLFRQIKESCLDQIPGLDRQLPESVILTQPACASSQWRDLLEHGAEAAGFLKVEAFKEPIAAARGWLYAQSTQEDTTIMVLDCGGGTTDWAVVEWRNGRPNLTERYKPHSLNLGGSDVDRSLLHHVQKQDSDLVGSQNPKKLLNKLKVYKDSILSGQATEPLRIGGRTLSLDLDTIHDIYQHTFVDPLLQQFMPELEAAGNTYPKLQLLLTGGGGHSLLVNTLKLCTKIPLYAFPESGLSVLRGSLGISPDFEHIRQTQRNQEIPLQKKKKKTDSVSTITLDIPDIHGWDSQPVKDWQQEVAKKLGLPIIQQDTLKDGTLGPEMVLIPPGKYMMGSPTDESGRKNNEGPIHQVTISQPFYLGRHAVSFGYYDHYCEVVGGNKPPDSGWGRSTRPAINVNWENARAYCNWLSKQTAGHYRLPKEEEWEYACRAGTKSKFSSGNDLSWGVRFHETESIGDSEAIWWIVFWPYAMHQADKRAQRAKERKKTAVTNMCDPNNFGLIQMHGNVWEWCKDNWTGSYGNDRMGANSEASQESIGFNLFGSFFTSVSTRQVIRGGAWNSDKEELRSAFRKSAKSSQNSNSIGFRLARDIPSVR